MAHATLEYVIRLAESLSSEDKQTLVGHLNRQLDEQGSPEVMEQRAATETKPTSLRGTWRDQFPPDLDVDAILAEIRSEWEGEPPEALSP
jgi:hypothetical protein